MERRSRDWDSKAGKRSEGETEAQRGEMICPSSHNKVPCLPNQLITGFSALERML